MDDKNSLSHTKWNCKYHIVFAPKYRRKIIYGELKVELGKVLRQLCEWKEIKIIEAELCVDHVHMLVEIPPKTSVSSFVGYLKGKSSLMIHERHGNAVAPQIIAAFCYHHNLRQQRLQEYNADGDKIHRSVAVFAVPVRAEQVHFKGKLV